MSKRVYSGPIGSPLSKGIATEGLLFLSGQVAGPDADLTIESQTKLTLRNVAEALHECGSSADQVVKATIYLTDMSMKSAMNEVYQDFFGNNLPTRTTVGVNDLGEGVLIEIDVIAAITP